MNIKKKGRQTVQIIALSFVVFSLLLSVGSCSDKWDDHYDVSSVDNGTLWEAIVANPQLSNFARVAKVCGYDEKLNGSQTYSVFAPTNDSFSAQEADSLITACQQQMASQVRSNENTVVRQFLQNHIALYKHPVSSLTNDTVTMMNSKYQLLTSSRLGSRRFLTSNQLYNNGLLFTLDHKLDYTPNVFEYLGHDNDLDSVYQFLNSYSAYEFNEAKSVPGEIRDGEVHYLDSVSELRNTIMDTYGNINSEDSAYWFVCPTNNEWNRLVAEYEKYFNYPNSVNNRDSMVYASTRLAIIGGAFFSRSVNSDAALRDSAVSTQAMSGRIRQLIDTDYPYYTYYKPFDNGGIFEGTKSIACSNGCVLKADDFRISKLNTFAQTVKVEAENIQSQDTVRNALTPLSVREVTTSNPFYGKVSGNAFVEVIPNSPTAKVAAAFKIPNVLSGMGYDIYAVFVPATAYDPQAVEETTKPCIVQSTLRQMDQNGHESIRRFRKNLFTDPTRVDTLLMAENVTFTTCSYGFSDAQVKLEIVSNVNDNQTATNSLTLRIDCLIVKPREN